jgi:hypothetical protein
MICVCLISLLCLGFATQTNPLAAAGNTYYVSTTGSDNNPGTLAKPWLTVQKAANTVVVGDTVNIEAGTYNAQFTITTSGTAANPITFQNYNGGTVVIDGTSAGITEYGIGNIAGGASNITLSGLTFRNSPYFGLMVHADGIATSNITFQNITAYNCGCSGICVTTNYDSSFSSALVSNVLINGCTVYNCNTNNNFESISMAGVTNFVIENCTEYGSPYSAGAGIDVKVGCAYGSIHNCTVYGNASPGIYCDARLNEHDISIYDNLVDNNTKPGIELADENGQYLLSNINIYNNIIYGNKNGLQLDHYGTETINFSFVNNTLYNNSAAAGEIIIGEPDTNLSNCIIRNNIIYSATEDACGILYSDYANGGVTIDHNLFYNSAGSWSSDNLLGTSYVTGNPMLTSPTTNFSLQGGSPAIGVGSSTGAPATDYAGATRTSPPCIGAYEYTSSSPSISQSSVSNGVVGTAYKQTLAATGGISPYTWTITSGTLPAGLSLSSNGVISGTPTTACGPTPVTFQVTDTNNATGTKSLSISVVYSAWDANEDGVVNVLDMILIAQDLGETGPPGWIREDVNDSGVISVLDLIIVGQHWTV